MRIITIGPPARSCRCRPDGGGLEANAEGRPRRAALRDLRLRVAYQEVAGADGVVAHAVGTVGRSPVERATGLRVILQVEALT